MLIWKIRTFNVDEIDYLYDKTLWRNSFRMISKFIILRLIMFLKNSKFVSRN